MEDPVHRLFNALEPGTYIRPHRHLNPPRTETILAVRGAVGVILFDEMGMRQEACLLTAAGSALGMHLPPETWHALVALEGGTVFFETKEGPYVAPAGNDVASWAPPEGTPEAAVFESTWRGFFLEKPR